MDARLRTRLLPSAGSLIVLVLAAMALGQSPQDPESAASETPAAELVRQLSAPDYAQREAAARRLIKLGTAAIPAVEQGVASSDREIRYRSQRLLATIRRNELERRLERFVRDGDEATAKTLPAWEIYRELVGDTPESRQLFIEMQRAEGELLAAIEKGGVDASRRLAERVVRIQQNTVTYEQDVSLASTAAVLLAAGRDDIAISQQPAALIFGVCQTAAARRALEGGVHEQFVRKLISPWIAREGDSSATYQALQFAMHYKLQAGLKTADRILRKHQAESYLTMQALLCVARLGDESHTPLVEPLLGDVSEYGQRRIGENNRQVSIQVRDIALATLVHLTKQKYTDYGLRYIQPNPQTVFTVNSACFESDEDRQQALTRWRDYREKSKPDKRKSGNGDNSATAP